MNLSLPLVIWTLLNLVGLAVTLVGLRDALGDLAILEQAGLNGVRKAIAHGNVRLETMRSAVLALFVAAGMVAILAPIEGGSRIAHNPDGVAAFATYALILASLLLVSSSVLDRRDRGALIRLSMLAAEQKAAASAEERRLTEIEETGADTNATAHRVEDALQKDGDG